MKKINVFKNLVIAFFCIAVTLSAKGQILFEDFSLAVDSNTTDISGTIDTYTSTPGWTGNKIYQATGKVKIGTASVQGFITTPAIDLSGNGGNFTIRFNAKKWNNDQSTIKVYVDETEYIVSGVTNTEMNQFTLTATGGTNNTKIKFMGTQPANSRFFIDNIEIVQSSDPALIFTPSALVFSNAELNTATTRPITVTGQNLTASGSISIAVLGDGFTCSTTTLTCNDIMAQGGTTINVSFMPTTASDYTGTLTFTGGGLTTPVVYNLSGNGVEVAVVSTLAELRDAAPAFTGNVNAGTTIIKYDGEAIVTHKQSYNNVKYLQDESGAIMIYDPSGILSSGVNIGTKITNLMGTITNYYGMIEFVPTADVTQISPFNDISYTVATLSQFDADESNALQAKVVKVEGVTFTYPGSFATGSYYGLSQDGTPVDSVIYTDNYDADYIGTTMPSYQVDLMGVCLFKGSNTITNKNRIVLFDLTSNGIVSVENYNPSLVSLSPNPADNYVNFVVTENMQMDLYTATGVHVLTSSLHIGSNTISVSDYPQGLYLIKLINSNTGATRTAKLIVR